MMQCIIVMVTPQVSRLVVVVAAGLVCKRTCMYLYNVTKITYSLVWENRGSV